MRPKFILAFLLFSFLSAKVFGQSKKIDMLTKASERPLANPQALILTDYFIQSSMNSKSFFPDPTLAGNNTVITFTGTPDAGSDATTLKISFVSEDNLYPKPEYVPSTKSIYITMPISEYNIVIDQIERTIDKGGNKKLKGIYLDDGVGGSIGILQIIN